MLVVDTGETLYGSEGWGSSPPSAPSSQALFPIREGPFRFLWGPRWEPEPGSSSLAHRLSRRPLVTFEQVPIDVLGNGDAGVPEHFGDHVQRRPLSAAHAVHESQHDRHREPVSSRSVQELPRPGQR